MRSGRQNFALLVGLVAFKSNRQQMAMASLGGSVGGVCRPALVCCPVTELHTSPTCCRWPIRSRVLPAQPLCPPAAANVARRCVPHRRLMDRPQLVHIGHHVIPNALAQEMKVYAFQHDGYWHVSAAGLSSSCTAGRMLRCRGNAALLGEQAAWCVEPTAGRLLAEGMEGFNPRLLCAPPLVTAPFTP